MTCSHKACKPFLGWPRNLGGGFSLHTVCKDVQGLHTTAGWTGLTVTWKVGGWELTNPAGLVLATGGLDSKSGFTARIGGRLVRDSDQWTLIVKVASRLLAAQLMAA